MLTVFNIQASQKSMISYTSSFLGSFTSSLGWKHCTKFLCLPSSVAFKYIFRDKDTGVTPLQSQWNGGEHSCYCFLTSLTKKHPIVYKKNLRDWYWKIQITISLQSSSNSLLNADEFIWFEIQLIQNTACLYFGIVGPIRYELRHVYFLQSETRILITF